METMILKEKRHGYGSRSPARDECRDLPVERPLSALRTGEYGTVSRLEGGEEFRGKMLALGILPGKPVRVARGGNNEPFVLRVEESRVMVDWATLQRIYVRTGNDFRIRGGWRWRWRNG